MSDIKDQITTKEDTTFSYGSDAILSVSNAGYVYFKSPASIEEGDCLSIEDLEAFSIIFTKAAELARQRREA